MSAQLSLFAVPAALPSPAAAPATVPATPAAWDRWIDDAVDSARWGDDADLDVDVDVMPAAPAAPARRPNLRRANVARADALRRELGLPAAKLGTARRPAITGLRVSAMDRLPGRPGDVSVSASGEGARAAFNTYVAAALMGGWDVVYLNERGAAVVLRHRA